MERNALYFWKTGIASENVHRLFANAIEGRGRNSWHLGRNIHVSWLNARFFALRALA
jgi:hypothetical protein